LLKSPEGLSILGEKIVYDVSSMKSGFYQTLLFCPDL